jgi:hypothetical protein
VALACALAGCKDTDRLTEVYYDQQAETVDYDAAAKVLVQDPGAEEETDLLPATDLADDRPDDASEELPDEGGEGDEGEAPEEDLSDNADDETSTQNGGVTLAGGGPDETDDEDADDGGDVEDPDADDGDSGEDGSLGGTSGARSGGSQLYYSSSGEHEDVPQGIDYVAAVGEAATIVSMLAGDRGALLYTDAAWAGRDNVAQVLGDKYNPDVAVAWSEDGDSYDLSDEMLQAMIDDERLECVFVVSGQRTLTAEQEEALSEAGIVVSYLPDLNTAADIKEAVQWVGSIFALGDEANADALALAEAYVAFHDEVLSSAARLSGTTVNDSSGAPAVSTSEARYTLYVSDWADDVAYVNASAGVELDTSQGIGITTLGYAWSPLAYYLSIGGAVNTASQSAQASGTALVWQFNTNHIPATASSFSRANLVSSYQTNSGNTAYGWTYLCSADFKGVGTEYFPYVIVSTQASKAKMEADKASDANSLYKIYGLQQTETANVTYVWVGPVRSAAVGYVGYSVGGLVAAQSSSQSEASLSATLDATDYEVVVNPCGLFESWTEGTVESVLEAAWASWLYRDGANPVETISDFYETFYGYTLSSAELAEILEGPVA